VGERKRDHKSGAQSKGSQLQGETDVDGLLFLKFPIGFPVNDVFQIEFDKLQIFIHGKNSLWNNI